MKGSFMRICKICKQKKEIVEFRKRKRWFSHTCKECYAKQYRTGKPNVGRFKKGNKPTCPFKKGIPSGRKGIKLSAEQIEKTASKLRGRKLSQEHIDKIKHELSKRYKNHQYSKARRGIKSIKWSLAVRNRDGNKCTRCGTMENLHAHHIVPWRVSEELRYEISNGITLCNSCHHKEERKCFPKGAWNKGKKLSDEHKKKLSDVHKGKVPWNKGLKSL